MKKYKQIAPLLIATVLLLGLATSSVVTAQTQDRGQRNDRAIEATTDVCSRHLDTVNRLTAQVVAISERQIGIFDTVFERVDRLYIRLELNAENYNDQVVLVASNRNNAYRQLNVMRSLSDDFDCEPGAFRSKIAEFRDARFNFLDIMKDYRSSLVDLIVMIQSSAENQGIHGDDIRPNDNESSSGVNSSDDEVSS